MVVGPSQQPTAQSTRAALGVVIWYWIRRLIMNDPVGGGSYCGDLNAASIVVGVLVAADSSEHLRGPRSCDLVLDS